MTGPSERVDVGEARDGAHAGAVRLADRRVPEGRRRRRRCRAQTTVAATEDLRTGWTVTFGGTALRHRHVRSAALLGRRCRGRGTSRAPPPTGAPSPCPPASARPARASSWISARRAPSSRSACPSGTLRGNSFAALFAPPIREAATVFVNGRRAGSVWAPPYRVDVTSLLRPGANDDPHRRLQHRDQPTGRRRPPARYGEAARALRPALPPAGPRRTPPPAIGDTLGATAGGGEVDRTWPTAGRRRGGIQSLWRDEEADARRGARSPRLPLEQARRGPDASPTPAAAIPRPSLSRRIR